MKLSEAIKNFDPNKSEPAPIDYDAFMENLDIHGHFNYHEEDEFLKYFKAYYVQKRMDTDTVVGLIIFYFFKDRFVCLSRQRGRRHSIEIEWKNIDSYRTIRTYMNCFVNGYDFPINIINDNDDIKDFYELSWASEIMDEIAFYKDEVVEIIEYEEHNSKYVNVRRKSGLTENLLMSDLKFKNKGF